VLDQERRRDVLTADGVTRLISRRRRQKDLPPEFGGGSMAVDD